MRTDQEVIKLIKDNISNTKDVTDYSNKIQVHTRGKNLALYLAKINGYENDQQKELRDRFAISNKFLTNIILRKTDNIWCARGGSYTDNFKSDVNKEEFNNTLDVIWEGQSLDRYVKSVVFDSLINDPNSLSYVELDIDDNELKIEQIPSENIFYIERDGLNVEAFLLYPETENVNGQIQKKYLYYDKENIFVILEIDGVYTLDVEKSKENSFGFVPACFNSDSYDYLLEYNLSPLDGEVELLDSYVRKNSVLEIHEFLHGYPKFWAYMSSCPVCKGFGKIAGVTCSHCNGSGNLRNPDVSDGIKLRPPQGDEPKLAPDIMGYIVPPIDSWTGMRDGLKWLKALIEWSHWGVITDNFDNTDEKTATASYIETQPISNRLTKYKNSVEFVHNELLNIIGKIQFPLTFGGASKRYGNRFILESSDAAIKKYIDARIQGIANEILDYLLEQYLMSEFQNNDSEYQEKHKLCEAEPFVHSTIKEVMDNPYINTIDKLAKAYFNEYKETLSDIDIEKMDYQQIKEGLYKYVSTKELPIIQAPTKI